MEKKQGFTMPASLRKVALEYNTRAIICNDGVVIIEHRTVKVDTVHTVDVIFEHVIPCEIMLTVDRHRRDDDWRKETEPTIAYINAPVESLIDGITRLHIDIDSTSTRGRELKVFPTSYRYASQSGAVHRAMTVPDCISSDWEALYTDYAYSSFPHYADKVRSVHDAVHAGAIRIEYIDGKPTK
jgi:hypothetical protein